VGIYLVILISIIIIVCYGISISITLYKFRLGSSSFWTPNCTYKIKEILNSDGHLSYRIYRCKHNLKGYYSGYGNLKQAIDELKVLKRKDEELMRQLKFLNSHKSRWVSDDEIVVEDL